MGVRIFISNNRQFFPDSAFKFRIREFAIWIYDFSVLDT